MEAEPPRPAPDSAEDGRPPLGSWGRLYALLVGALAVEIGLLWALARSFG
jgi:hypothetical protein